MIWYKWTFWEFFSWVMFAVFCLALTLFVAWNMDVSMRGRALLKEKVDTRLTDAHCWKWSEKYPVTAYNSCQNQFFGGGR